MTNTFSGVTNTSFVIQGAADLSWAKVWLGELTYRPGWYFELRDGSTTMTNGWTTGPGCHLLVSAEVPDSNNPDGPLVRINHSLPIHPAALANREAFHRVVLRAVIAVETHEAMEYLKANGERVLTPHPSPGAVLYEPGP